MIGMAAHRRLIENLHKAQMEKSEMTKEKTALAKCRLLRRTEVWAGFIFRLVASSP